MQDLRERVRRAYAGATAEPEDLRSRVKLAYAAAQPKEPEPEKPKRTYGGLTKLRPRNVVEQIGSGALEIVGGTLEQAGEVVERLGGESRLLKPLGQEIKKGTYPPDPELGVAGEIVRGVGSSVGLAAGGVGGRMGIALTGVLATGHVEGEAARARAIASGASEQAADNAAWQAAVRPWTIASGASEVIPLGNIMARVNRATGGKLNGVVLNLLKEGVEEAGQEYAQEFVSLLNENLDATEKRTIREILATEQSRLVRAGLVGAAAVGPLSLLGSAVGMKMGAEKAPGSEPAGSTVQGAPGDSSPQAAAPSVPQATAPPPEVSAEAAAPIPRGEGGSVAPVASEAQGPATLATRTEETLFGAEESEVAEAKRAPGRELGGAKAVQPNLLDVQEGDLPGQRSLLDEPKPKTATEKHRERMAAAAAGKGTLQDFVRAMGGISTDGKTGTELWQRFSRKEAGVKGRVGMSPVVQQKGSGKGVTWEEALHSAQTAGFFPGKGDVSFDEFAEALESNPVAGSRVGQETAELAAREQLMHDEGVSEEEAAERVRANPELAMQFYAGPSMEWPFKGKPRQTQTPEFKRWFGASKVTDEKGAPKVVYHGTNQPITSFSKERGGAVTRNASAEAAIWFSDNPEVAGEYAAAAGRMVVADVAAHEKATAEAKALAERLEKQARRTGNWDPYYRAVEAWEELEIGAVRADESTGQNIVPAHLSIQNPLVHDFGGSGSSVGEISALTERAISEGKDGLILRNLADPTTPATHYAVFRPEQIKSATGNRGTFDPNDPKLMHAGGTLDSILAISDDPLQPSTLKKFFTSAGNMPVEAFKAWNKRRAEIAKHAADVRFGLKAFKRAVKEAVGSAALTEDQTKLVNEALKGEVPIKSLPEAFWVPVTRMRQGIDAMSREMIRSGVVEGDLAGKIEANLGLYLNRSYRAHDDPDWAQNVPAGVRERAAQMFRRKHPQATEPEVQGWIDAYLFGHADAPGRLIATAQGTSKDLSILRARKPLEPEIRELLGEYEDPAINYAKSVGKMAHLVATHRFLEDVRAMGLRDGWLSETPTSTSNLIAEIAPEGSKVLSPLNGLYTTPEIQDAFKNTVEPQTLGPMMRTYMTALTAIKAGKTIGSVASTARNFLSNIGFIVAGAHWRVGKLGDAFQGLIASTGLVDNRKWQAAYTDAVAHGVVQESTGANELREMVNDAAGRDVFNAFDDQLKAGNVLVRTGKALRAFYQAQDDFWKLYAWHNERARQAKMHPDWSEVQVKEKAAEIIRNTMPTYSLVPRAVREFRRSPLVGSFVSFPAEVVRTTGHQLALIKQELADPQTRGAGLARLAGTVAAMTMSEAMAATLLELAGLTPDDEDALRDLAVPPWSKNHALGWFKDDQGQLHYVDFGYTDPYSYIKAPIRAFLRGEGDEGGVVGALREGLDPYLGLEIGTEAAAELWANKKAGSGAPIWNEQAPWTDKAKDMTEFLWQKLQPGTLATLERINSARLGKVSPYGKKFDLEDELVAAAGVRITPVDLPQSLGFKARDYRHDRDQATSILTEVASNRGTVTEAQVRDAYSSLEQTRAKLYEEMSGMIAAASKLGMSRAEIRGILERDIGEEAAKDLLNGVYKPYRPTSQFLRTKGIPQETAKLYEERRRWIIQAANSQAP